MARIAGVNIPDNLQLFMGLQKIYGIGKSRAIAICKTLDIHYQTKITNLSVDVVENVRNEVAKYVIEGNLRREVGLNIKRLVDLKCYRGVRHVKGLPVRGQRTKTNARTRKGKIKTVANKKK